VKLTPFQSSFCISVFSHVIAFGLYMSAGNSQRPVRAEQDLNNLSLEMTIAPVELASTARPGAQATLSRQTLPRVPVEQIVQTPVVETRPSTNQKHVPAEVFPDPIPLPDPIHTTTPQTVAGAKVVKTIPVEPALQTSPTVARSENSSLKSAEVTITPTQSRGVVSKPNFLRNPKPQYPPLARRRGWEGTVLVGVRVTTAGRAGEVWVKQSSGHTVLDEAAVKAALGYDYIPAIVDGVAIESKVEFEMPFELPK